MQSNILRESLKDLSDEHKDILLKLILHIEKLEDRLDVLERILEEEFDIFSGSKNKED